MMLGLGRPNNDRLEASAQASSCSPSKHPRQSSGAYNVFESSQIQTFKEAFSMMDADGDGFVSKQDVQSILANLGLDSSKPKVDAFFAAPGTADRISFTTFVSMFAQRMQDMDAETDLVEAFACLDDDDKGWIDGQELKKWLKEVGDRMSDSEVDRLLQGPFTDKKGRFNYREFCATLRVTEGDAVQPL